MVKIKLKILNIKKLTVTTKLNDGAKVEDQNDDFKTYGTKMKTEN